MWQILPKPILSERRPFLLMRLAVIGLAGLALSFGIASSAAADPNPDLTPARSFNLDCGTAGIFPVVFVESNLGTFHVVGTTSIFQSTSLTIDGTLIFAEPGSDRNAVAELTCGFVGVLTGRHFTVTGFFTPPSH
jgi:hypothetical protein